MQRPDTMTTPNLSSSAIELGWAIEKQTINPVELVEACIESVENNHIAKTIYSVFAKDRALNEAKEASIRAKNGQRLSLLDGVPISWKDLFDTEGIPTEGGTKFLAGRIPKADAEVVRRCANAGLVCLGKTHLSELAFSGLGFNPITATPPCINDDNVVPGGSSSGAAASVAFKMAAIGIGSDTGGSVRVPACWNDLVGLKTTHSLIPLTGVIPLCNSFDTVGPLCRTVEDAAQIFSIMVQKSPINLRGVEISRCTFLVPQASTLEYIQSQPEEGFNQVISQLSHNGATIAYKSLPVIDEANELAGCLYGTEAYSQWGETIEANPNTMFARIQERFLTGKRYSGADFVRAWQKLKSLRDLFYQETAGYDALLLPTCPILPPLKERIINEPDYYVQQNLLALRNTRLSNLFNLSALTIPTPIPSTGISVISSPFNENQVLRVGQAIANQISELIRQFNPE